MVTSVEMVGPVRRRRRAGAGSLALLLLGLGLGTAAAKPATRVDDSLPLPPAPPATPPNARRPVAAPPAGAPGHCSRDDVSDRAARLVLLLEALILQDPARARGLLDEFQAATQSFQQSQASLEQTCRAYDGLIARAGG